MLCYVATTQPAFRLPSWTCGIEPLARKPLSNDLPKKLINDQSLAWVPNAPKRLAGLLDKLPETFNQQALKPRPQNLQVEILKCQNEASSWPCSPQCSFCCRSASQGAIDPARRLPRVLLASHSTPARIRGFLRSGVEGWGHGNFKSDLDS